MIFEIHPPKRQRDGRVMEITTARAAGGKYLVDFVPAAA